MASYYTSWHLGRGVLETSTGHLIVGRGAPVLTDSSYYFIIILTRLHLIRMIPKVVTLPIDVSGITRLTLQAFAPPSFCGGGCEEEEGQPAPPVCNL
ncbi:MAG TPA: hypothetical protein VE378_00750 [Nitrososphaeraceae archaeon]|nr:hypothetical protein [Nitrososphaeraceae archaeon]